MLTNIREERAEAIHREAVVFLSHRDVLLLDISPRQKPGEIHVMKKSFKFKDFVKAGCSLTWLQVSLKRSFLHARC